MKRDIFIFCALLLLLGSCKKATDGAMADAEPKSSIRKREAEPLPETETVLGPQRNNPYTPENMEQAAIALQQQGVALPENWQVRTTHYYVKYMPENWEQYQLLHDDTNHVFFDYPLDRAIEAQGNRYHDPEIADSLPQYQYTAIEEGFPLDSRVPYEVLSSLYLPEQDKALKDVAFLDRLLDQAYLQTGNEDDTGKVDGGTAARGTNYQPGGQILINDNRLNQDIGMEGVLVTARRWFTIFKGRTDYNGNYLVNGYFSRPCNYRVHFEAPHFNVRETFFNIIAYVDGPKTRGSWNTTIGQGYSNFVGHIFRGAYRYHYKSIDGLTRPINPMLHSTNYIAKDQQGSIQGVNYGVIPIIKLWRRDPSSGRYYASDELFSSACHETAHLAHIILLNNHLPAYLTVGGKIRESWAVAVEWWLTGKEYKERGIANYGEWNYYAPDLGFPNQYGYQYWTSGANLDKYTSLFINCIDTYNELNQPFGGTTGTVNDVVGRTAAHHLADGYSIQSLERNVMRYAVDLTTTSNSLKAHKPNGVTNEDIDLLISFY